MKILCALGVMISMLGHSAMAQEAGIQGGTIVLPDSEAGALRATGIDAYPDEKLLPDGSDRFTVVATKVQRGTTQDVPLEKFSAICGDRDGCSVRLGMHNWDDTGRVASREFLIFYNRQNNAWRASNDAWGTNKNNVTQHLLAAWSCYVTDGTFANWQNNGDPDDRIGLLSWNDSGFNADCIATFID